MEKKKKKGGGAEHHSARRPFRSFRAKLLFFRAGLWPVVFSEPHLGLPSCVCAAWSHDPVSQPAGHERRGHRDADAVFFSCCPASGRERSAVTTRQIGFPPVIWEEPKKTLSRMSGPVGRSTTTTSTTAALRARSIRTVKQLCLNGGFVNKRREMFLENLQRTARTRVSCSTSLSLILPTSASSAVLETPAEA